MKKHKYTYEKSGVNIAAADNFISFISKISSKNKKKISMLIILEALVQFQTFQII